MFCPSPTLTYLNGQVASANDSVNGNWSSFTYDSFGRLQSSWCSANCPDGTNAEGYNYTYDEYGNRWNQSQASGSGPGFTPSYKFDINNHLTPTSCTNGAGNFCYDGAGNLHYDGMGGNWGYDAEGRVFAYDSSSETDRYTSDGLGQRVERVLNGSVYDYVFDNQGHENTKATGGFAASAWSELYLGGMHVNTYANGSTYFSHSDHLGSERTETDPTGNTNGSYETNLPFGEWTGSGFESEKGFTGDLLDNADGYVFHTPFRQYTQAQGRWMIPDPAGLAAVNPTNPQTWNRYAYVGNNPTSYRDPTGLVATNPGFAGLSRGMGFFASGGGNFVSGCTQDGIDSNCILNQTLQQAGATSTCLYSPCVGEMGLRPDGTPAYIAPGIDGENGFSVCGSVGPADDQSYDCDEGTIGGDDSSVLLAGNGTGTTACPPVPAHPANANVNSNISLTRTVSYLGWLNPPTQGAFMATWLTLMVRPSGPWDYKTQGQNFDAFGNFNFGAAGAAAGYPLAMLQMGAGAVSTLVGTNSSAYGSWYQPPLYGHAPIKSQQIAAGYAYYQQGCK